MADKAGRQGWQGRGRQTGKARQVGKADKEAVNLARQERRRSWAGWQGEAVSEAGWQRKASGPGQSGQGVAGRVTRRHGEESRQGEEGRQCKADR
jgi:hypothetical protein